MEKSFYGVLYVLSPLIFFALPSMVISVVCGPLGIALKSRELVVTAACCSVPMILYVLLMGKVWWGPLLPIVIVMYFGAAYVVPKQRALVAALVVPYLIFMVTIVNVLYLRR